MTLSLIYNLELMDKIQSEKVSSSLYAEGYRKVQSQLEKQMCTQSRILEKIFRPRRIVFMKQTAIIQILQMPFWNVNLRHLMPESIPNKE